MSFQHLFKLYLTPILLVGFLVIKSQGYIVSHEVEAVDASLRQGYLVLPDRLMLSYVDGDDLQSPAWADYKIDENGRLYLSTNTESGKLQTPVFGVFYKTQGDHALALHSTPNNQGSWDIKLNLLKHDAAGWEIEAHIQSILQESVFHREMFNFIASSWTRSQSGNAYGATIISHEKIDDPHKFNFMISYLKLAEPLSATTLEFAIYDNPRFSELQILGADETDTNGTTWWLAELPSKDSADIGFIHLHWNGEDWQELGYYSAYFGGSTYDQLREFDGSGYPRFSWNSGFALLHNTQSQFMLIAEIEHRRDSTIHTITHAYTIKPYVEDSIEIFDLKNFMTIGQSASGVHDLVAAFPTERLIIDHLYPIRGGWETKRSTVSAAGYGMNPIGIIIGDYYSLLHTENAAISYNLLKRDFVVTPRWPDSTNFHNGFEYSSTLGWTWMRPVFSADENAWAWLEGLGWVYGFIEQAQGTWFYHPYFGWCKVDTRIWNKSLNKHWFYAAPAGEFLYRDASQQGQRSYYSYSSQRWMSEQRAPNDIAAIFSLLELLLEEGDEITFERYNPTQAKSSFTFTEEDEEEIITITLSGIAEYQVDKSLPARSSFIWEISLIQATDSITTVTLTPQQLAEITGEAIGTKIEIQFIFDTESTGSAIVSTFDSEGKVEISPPIDF